uniref:Vacuolar protein sorting-associated protein 51 homolog n=3 Tax=Hirondellea gigas TaxID=1518452 RepID=A0A2P2I0W7_9CRUS
MESSNSRDRRKRSELLEYYDAAGNTATNTPPTLDLHSKHFDAKQYAQKLIKECSLKQLLEEEVTLSSTAHRLDSDCQTLVYEHYDKFLHATDLVQKLKEGSSDMEDQLQQLQENMALITESSSAITSGLKERREELSKLLSAHNTLHKLEFLFQLPRNIDRCIAEGDMQQGVACYLNTCSVLQRYRHLSSLAAVQADCHKALDRLKLALHSTITQGNSRELASSVELLLELGEPKQSLQDSFLLHAQHKLRDDMTALQDLAAFIPSNREGEESAVELQHRECGGGDERRVEECSDDRSHSTAAAVQEQRFAVDLLVFIDRCHDTFVANLWLLISSYQEMFLSSTNKSSCGEARAKLCELVDSSITSLLGVVQLRVAAEVELHPMQCHVMATALDKLHRRLKALETMMGQCYYTQWSLDLVLEATRLQCEQCLSAMKLALDNTLADVRQGIASGGGSSSGGAELSSLLSHLVASIAGDIKHNLHIIMVFSTSGCTYSSEDLFKRTFILQQVREDTVVAFLLHLTRTLAQFASSGSASVTSPLTSPSNGAVTTTTGGGGSSSARVTSHVISSSTVAGCPGITSSGAVVATSAGLLLVLAKAAGDLHLSTAHYVLRECDESLGVSKISQEVSGGVVLTPSEHVTSRLKQAAQDLLNAYVARQGSALAQLLVRSVELKDWLGCGEPRSVRRVMRTVREDIEASEAQVGALYEEGARKERSSDSSRRTYHSVSTAANRSTTNWSSSGRLNNTLNLSKLWCDRIEIFSPVLPDKLSIMTGIVKIALKSVEEGIRMRTLGKYGLQQVQVDVYYLRTHLWRHVTDDTLLNVLLDAILTAAAQRCCEPELMEHSVVEFICDQ